MPHWQTTDQEACAWLQWHLQTSRQFKPACSSSENANRYMGNCKHIIGLPDLHLDVQTQQEGTLCTCCPSSIGSKLSPHLSGVPRVHQQLSQAVLDLLYTLRQQHSKNAPWPS